MKSDRAFTLRGILIMLVISVIIATALYSANLMPSLIDKGFARQYGSLEEVRRTLGNEHITIPNYFPEGIRWPPSYIVAQRSPFWGIVMEFQSRDSEQTVLSIIQTDLKGLTESFRRLDFKEVREEVEYSIKKNKAILKVGICDNGWECNSIRWQDKTRRFEILSTSSPFETMKIAEGMMH